MSRIRVRCHVTAKVGIPRSTVSFKSSSRGYPAPDATSGFLHSSGIPERLVSNCQIKLIGLRYFYAACWRSKPSPFKSKGVSFSTGWNNSKVEKTSSSDGLPVATPASVWKKKNCTIHIMGTQHAEAAYVAAAPTLIQQVKPDAVFVELDRQRFDPGENYNEVHQRASKSGNDTIIPTGPSTKFIEQELRHSLPERDDFSLVQSVRWSLLRFFQVPYNWFHLTIRDDDLDDPAIRATNEYFTAIYEARQMGVPIILGDRDIFVTQERIMRAMAMQPLTFSGGAATETKAEEQENELVQLSTEVHQKMEDFRSAHGLLTKERQEVRSMYRQYRPAMGALVYPYIAERDLYMAHSMNDLRTQFQHIVALVGMIHVDGMETVLWKKGWRPCGSWKP